MSIAAELTLGLTRLQKRGWRAGQYGTPTRGPVCMISALDVDMIGACRPYLREAIQASYGQHWNVNGWQDTPGRRFSEVEEVFTDAIWLAQKAEAAEEMAA